MSEEKKEQSFLDKMKGSFEELKEKADKVWDKVEDKTEDVWDTTKEKAAELKEKVAHKIDEWQGDKPEAKETKPTAPEQPLK